MSQRTRKTEGVQFVEYWIAMGEAARPNGLLIDHETARAFYEQTDLSPNEAVAAHLGFIAHEALEWDGDELVNPNDRIADIANILGDATLCDQW